MVRAITGMAWPRSGPQRLIRGLRGLRVAFALLLGALLLAGCATRAPERHACCCCRAPDTLVYDLSGRISLRQGKESNTGQVRWHHAMPEHDITVLSPIGTMVAHIEQDGNGVKLTTPDQEIYHATDADHLMHQILGWGLPLNGMQYWILGRPAPTTKADVENDADNNVRHMVQDEWKIDFSNYRKVATTPLPGKIILHRDDIEIRMVIDSWNLVPAPIESR